MQPCNNCFPDTLRYTSPAHGGWGVVRMGMLVPESHQLFVCPFACGRHGAIGALHQGYKDRVSYLYINEADIVSGGYEDLIPEAVDELLSELPKRPRALMIFVSCLDDLLGTDHEAFLRLLREKHPDMRFTVCHMNPITQDSKLPPPIHIQKKMYGLLEPSKEKKNAVNLVGNLVDILPESELYSLLHSAGFEEINHISRCADYDAFKELAASRMNVVVGPRGLVPAKDMKKSLGIDYVYVPVSYDMDETEEVYRKIYAAAGKDAGFDVAGARAKAEESLAQTREALAGLPIVVDASATVRPFSMAKLLLNHGFQVSAVYAQECSALEKSAFQWITERSPEVRILQPEHHNSPKNRASARECLAIGFEGAYLSGAGHVVDMAADEGLYGYAGITELMRKMQKAANTRTDLHSMIHSYGLVI